LTPRESIARIGGFSVRIERRRIDCDTIVFEDLNAMIVVRCNHFQEQIIIDIANANIKTIFT